MSEPTPNLPPSEPPASPRSTDYLISPTVDSPDLQSSSSRSSLLPQPETVSVHNFHPKVSDQASMNTPSTGAQGSTVWPIVKAPQFGPPPTPPPNGPLPPLPQLQAQRSPPHTYSLYPAPLRPRAPSTRVQNEMIQEPAGAVQEPAVQEPAGESAEQESWPKPAVPEKSPERLKRLEELAKLKVEEEEGVRKIAEHGLHKEGESSLVAMEGKGVVGGARIDQNIHSVEGLGGKSKTGENLGSESEDSDGGVPIYWHVVNGVETPSGRPMPMESLGSEDEGSDGGVPVYWNVVNGVETPSGKPMPTDNLGSGGKSSDGGARLDSKSLSP